MSKPDHDGGHHDIMYPSVIPFVLMHLGCLAAIWTGVTWTAVGLCAGLYFLRMFGIVAGYHRYFSHRAFATGRAFQFVLAILAQSSAQKSVLWWAAKHRQHHLHADTADDVHSPRQSGVLYSHVGWIFDRKHDQADLTKVADLGRWPELMWLQRNELAPAAGLAVLCFLVAGWPGVVIGFLWSTVLLYHATFCINSLAHLCGRTRYVTGDDSRNNWALAVVTLGEGWHNNHHAYQSSARQGFKWWEIDVAYYALICLARLGLIWDLKSPPGHVLRNEQRLGTRVINRAAEQLAAHFNPELIAQAIVAMLQGPALASLQDALARGQARTSEILASLQLPDIPSRDKFLAQAKAMFARTVSLDEIVDRANEMLLASVGAHLSPVALTERPRSIANHV